MRMLRVRRGGFRQSFLRACQMAFLCTLLIVLVNCKPSSRWRGGTGGTPAISRESIHHERNRFALAPRTQRLEPRYLIAIDFQDFNGTQVPVNGDGEQFPSWTDGRGGEGGVFTASINTSDAVSGH